MTFPLLEIEDLHASYDRDAEVLHGIDVRVQEHEIVAILGSNGAGKTTVANAVCGLVPHTRGGIRFAGEEIAGLAPHVIAARGLIQAPAGRAVFADQTVAENLLVGAHAHRRDRARVRRGLDAMLDRFEILGRMRDRPAGLLSGGEQQVLSIARALMGRPRLLILDEPSMGLAPVMAKAVFDLIAQVHADGVTVLMIEKRARLVQSVAQRLYVMELGRVVAEGPAALLSDDPRIEDAYLGQKVWDDPGEAGNGAGPDANA